MQVREVYIVRYVDIKPRHCQARASDAFLYLAHCRPGRLVTLTIRGAFGIADRASSIFDAKNRCAFLHTGPSTPFQLRSPYPPIRLALTESLNSRAEGKGGDVSTTLLDLHLDDSAPIVIDLHQRNTLHF